MVYPILSLGDRWTSGWLVRLLRANPDTYSHAEDCETRRQLR